MYTGRCFLARSGAIVVWCGRPGNSGNNEATRPVASPDFTEHQPVQGPNASVILLVMSDSR